MTIGDWENWWTLKNDNNLIKWMTTVAKIGTVRQKHQQTEY